MSKSAKHIAALVTVALVAVVLRYLQDWFFEGLVRVAVNGRLDELHFHSPPTLSCPLQSKDSRPGAYVTVLGTADYLPGARVLVRDLAALRRGAAYPLVVLVPDDVAPGVEQPMLDDAAHHSSSHDVFEVHVKRIQRINYTQGWTTAGCRYWWLNVAGHYAELEHSLNKLWAFDLVEYATIIYVDADVLPFKAPDELFALAAARRHATGPALEGDQRAPLEHPPFFAAAPDWGRHGGDAPGFNAGVFVATPCAGLRQHLLHIAASPASARAARCHRRGTADQPLLQYFFGLDTVMLPVRYNMLQPGLVARPWLARLYPPVMLHFTKHKPWQVSAGSDVLQQPGMRDWRAICDQVQCCEPPWMCAPPRDPPPRGPHFKVLAEGHSAAGGIGGERRPSS